MRSRGTGGRGWNHPGLELLKEALFSPSPSPKAPKSSSRTGIHPTKISEGKPKT